MNLEHYLHSVLVITVYIMYTVDIECSYSSWPSVATHPDLLWKFCHIGICWSICGNLIGLFYCLCNTQVKTLRGHEQDITAAVVIAGGNVNWENPSPPLVVSLSADGCVKAWDIMQVWVYIPTVSTKLCSDKWLSIHIYFWCWSEPSIRTWCYIYFSGSNWHQ